MKVAAFIPIKSNSERVPGKNFRALNGEPLYKYIISSAVTSNSFNNIFVDTDSDEIKDYALSLKLNVIQRRPDLATDIANGNDLLNYHFQNYPNYDLYFQLFATAPLLRSTSIKESVDKLIESKDNDSIFTATQESGWFWFNRQPINYQPSILPRSQDAKTIVKETTGLYGITKSSLVRYKCRIGANPIIHEINPIEALDIDTEHEFLLAEKLADEVKIQVL